MQIGYFLCCLNNEYHIHVCMHTGVLGVKSVIMRKSTLQQRGFRLRKTFPVVRDHPASEFLPLCRKASSSWTDIDILPKGYRQSCSCISLYIAFPFPSNLWISCPLSPFRLGKKISLSVFNIHPSLSIVAVVISLCSSQWPCVVCGQKSYADCSLFSDAEWIAHSEQLCHSSQHPSLPPSHPSVTLHGVQRHHVGLCDRPHMAAAQWQCSLSPQLWHHHPSGLRELGCHARLRPFGRRLGPVTVLGARGVQRTEWNGNRERERWDKTQHLGLFHPGSL